MATEGTKYQINYKLNDGTLINLYAATVQELEKHQDSLKASFEGVLGTTNSGIEVSWTTVKGRETVDSTEVEKLLGFVPKKVGAESQRLSIKQSGGK